MASLTTTIAAAGVLALLAWHPARADCPPPRCFDGPVRVVVPFPPGGYTDQVARTLIPELSKSLGQPVVIDNRAGAGGAIGMEAVARSEPNSRTILVTSQASIVIAPLINSKLPTVPSRDLIPVVQLATYPQALLVRQDSPFKTLKNLLDHATKKPGGIVFGSSGNGSYGHLLGAQLAISSRTSLIHVPYRGMASAMVDLAGGQLDAVIVDFRSEEQQSKGIRALAVTGAQRVASAPEVPTFAELGFEGFESAWVGAFFPAGTDPAIVSRLNTEAQKVLQVASFKSELQKGGMATGTLNGERFAGLINTQSRRLAQVVRQTGIKAD